MTDINIGAITESLNYKSDLDLGNTSPQLVDYIVEQQLPSADNNYTWYDLYKSGKLVQGGRIDKGGVSISTETVIFPKEFSDAYYNVDITQVYTNATNVYELLCINPQTTQMQIGMTGSNWRACSWRVEGMAAGA